MWWWQLSYKLSMFSLTDRVNGERNVMTERESGGSKGPSIFCKVGPGLTIYFGKFKLILHWFSKVINFNTP